MQAGSRILSMTVSSGRGRSYAPLAGRRPFRTSLVSPDGAYRHFADQFRRYTGLTPECAARVIRVQNTMEALRSHTQMLLSELAVVCGYADQAHMSRDLLRFTGSTPDRFRRDPRLVPAGTVPSAPGAPSPGPLR